MPGTLFVVATPIGNLEDISLRALRVLREVGLIAAEDTRHTRILLRRHAIGTPLTSFHAHNERAKIPHVLDRLGSGDHVALVSDAGTPGVSDPGYRLVKETIARGFPVQAIPGASALLAALVCSGLPTDAFTFLGFPPSRSNTRKQWYESVESERRTLIFFEAPHRLRESLTDAQIILGDRPIMVGRELTKMHEELVRGPISSVLKSLSRFQGEVTIVMSGVPVPREDDIAATLPGDAAIWVEFSRLAAQSGSSRRHQIATLARRYRVSSREIYDAVERGKKLAE